MKKNVMMRVASALLVAVLLSTCTISGTFAKYVTTSSGNDNAEVMFVTDYPREDEEIALDFFEGKGGKIIQQALIGLGINKEKIYARNCEIRTTDNKSQFLKNNHSLILTYLY